MRRGPLVIVELESHKFRYVIFDIDQPVSTAAEIRRRVRDAEEL
ncbi:hypothetical protein [Bacillus sp. V5-8f]|nr:hypothetical protein [Bacillus sp. V5-8f]